MKEDHNVQESLGKIREAEGLKEKGNVFFKEKEYVKALRAYHQGLLFISGLVDKQSPMAAYTKDIIPEEIYFMANDLKFSLWLNMAQIYIFQNKYEKGREILDKASQIRENEKVLYRKGICYMHTGDYDKSRDCFKKINSGEESMKANLKKQLALLKQLEKKGDEKQKKVYAKFFAKE